MDWLVWIGTALAVLGLVGILYSCYLVQSARRENLADEALRARMTKILPINIGSLFVAILGLMTVVVGVMLA